MQEVLIRGIDFETKEEIHEYLAEELGFPSYYGKNLDALYDCLTDISEETRIVIDTEEMENDDLADYLHRVAEVMADAAEYNPLIEFETDNL